MNQFVNGASYLLSGTRLLTHKRILPFVIIPIILNIGLFYWGLSTLYEAFNTWLSQWIASIPEFLSFRGSVLRLLFIAAGLVIAAFSFTLFANLIGSPFYGLMAEQVSKLQHHTVAQPPMTLTFILALVKRTVWRELQKLLYYLARLIPLLLLWLILSFTPLAVVMPFIWFWFGAKMMTIQYVDYGYDNDGRDFGQVKTGLKKDRLTDLGFGTVATVLSMIPLINILAVPASVCGGTLYYVERLTDRNNRTELV